MLNYMKSECYRTFRQKSFYVMIGILGGLVLFLNVVLALSQHYIPDFRYGTVRFSLNNFTSVMHFMLVLGAMIPGCLFLDDRRNGIMKNAIAYGISREKLFLGKCIVAFAFSFLIMCVVLAVYVGSAYLLLTQPEWLPLKEMLTGMAASLPSAAASLILMIFLGAVCTKEITAVLVWASVYYLIPTAVFMAGLKFQIFSKISQWLPYNFLRLEVLVTFSDYHCLWDSAAGFAKCMISGGIGIAVFLGLGIWRFRKQEF